MGVTDCHVHINPVWEMRPDARAIVGTGLSTPELERYLREPRAFLDYLDRSGVERAVLVNYLSPEVVGYTEKANDFVLEYVQADPDRLIPVGGVAPEGREPGRAVERLHARGIRGIKIHPPHQLFSPDAYRTGAIPQLREVYEACERLHLPLIVHTGTSIFPRARNRFGQPFLLEDAAVDFPQLVIVLAHGGRPLWMGEATFLTRRFPNVYLELSSVPPPRVLEYFPDLPKISSRALFGSDWPGPGVRDIGENLARFRSLALTKDQLQAILVTNPERVFPRRAR